MGTIVTLNSPAAGDNPMLVAQQLPVANFGSSISNLGSYPVNLCQSKDFPADSTLPLPAGSSANWEQDQPCWGYAPTVGGSAVTVPVWVASTAASINPGQSNVPTATPAYVYATQFANGLNVANTSLVLPAPAIAWYIFGWDAFCYTSPDSVTLQNDGTGTIISGIYCPTTMAWYSSPPMGPLRITFALNAFRQVAPNNLSVILRLSPGV
jgi:hypothetical protein